MFRKIIHSPILSLIGGLILIITSAFEIWESFSEPGVGSHHGVAIFGLIQVFKSFPHLLHGAKEVDEKIGK